MADIVKIDGIAVANFSKVNGIAKASLSKVLGQTMPSAAYTSVNSVFFDGSNDYGKITGLNFPTTVGSVSFWFKMSDRYTSNQRIFSWHDDDAGGSYDDYYIVEYGPNSTSPSAAGIKVGHKSTVGGTALANHCSMKSSSSHHGTGWSRWKGNYDDVYNFSATLWPDFEYNARKLNEVGTHSYSPSPGSEHGWHQIVTTWDLNEVYTGKDAQSSHKFRPTASHDGTTTNHTGTQRIYMDGVLRNFGGSAYPSYNYQRTPNGMVEMTSTINCIYVAALYSGSSHYEGNLDDLAIHNVKLDDDAVAAMYNSGTPIDLTSNSGNYDNSSSLIGYWKFDEGSGTTIADSSSNSNDMTLYNSPTWDNGDAP